MFRWIRKMYKSWRDWRLRALIRRDAKLLPKEIRAMFGRRGICFPFDRLYFIGGKEYRDVADQDLVRDAIHRRDLAYLRNSAPAPPTSDHLLVYLLSGSENTAMLLGTISPYELWEPDVIFALQRCSIDECAGFLDQEVGKYVPPLPNDDLDR